MIFVKSSNLPSNQLRADQIAAELGARVYLNDLPETQETVVFVKQANPELVKRAKDQGCRIIFDPIDTFAYKERAGIFSWHYLVDVVIAYSPAQKQIYLRWFKECAIIPHQWDSFLDGRFCKQDRFRPAYIGHDFNKHEQIVGVPVISNPKDMMEAAPLYNCHVTLRDADSYQAIMKPATKLVTAAAVGAVCLTTKDPSAYWLIPGEYPYWVESPDKFQKSLEQAGREFGSDKWNEAIEILDGVRNKTSAREIAKLYSMI